jgi:isopenicillin N synthase-like dioxygenase
VCTTADLPGHTDAAPSVWPVEVPALRDAAVAFLTAAEAAHLELLRSCRRPRPRPTSRSCR